LQPAFDAETSKPNSTGAGKNLDLFEQIPTSRSLVLPPPTSAPDHTTLEVIGSVVIVGANGSGKTRLGSWLEMDSQQAAMTHRLAAQKSLVIPESCSTSSLDVAENLLFYGYGERTCA